MPTINNYTFSEPAFTMPEQSNIVSQVGATVVITITPNAGFTATAGDFTATSFNATYISNVAFTQSGDNVLCTMTLINTTTMPSSNLTLGLCVSGSAIEKLITIGGKYSAVVGSNVTGDSSETNVAYSASGIMSTVSSLFTKTYNAATGYFWGGPSIPSINIVKGNQKHYSIVQTPTFDASNRLTNIAYAVSYQFPDKDVSGDEISINVPSTQEIYVPVAKIFGYNFNTAGLGNLPETRNLTVFGGEGAAVTATLTYGATSTIIINNETITALGQITKPVAFPELIKGDPDVNYTLTLTGDVPSGGLTQPNPILVKQRNEILIRFLATTAKPISGFTQINRSFGNLLNSPFNPLVGNGLEEVVTPIPGTNAQGAFLVEINDTITASSGAIAVAKQLELADFSNTSAPFQESSAAQSSVTSLLMKDTTGIVAGMKFNRQIPDQTQEALFGIAGLAPYSHSVSSVDSATQLTVAPAITVNNNESLTFTSNNGNFFEVTSSDITSVNTTTINLKATLAIGMIGDAGIDFTLNLDNLITHTP